MAAAARWLGLLLCCVAGASAVSLNTASSGLVYEPDVNFHGSDEITVMPGGERDGRHAGAERDGRRLRARV